MELLIIFVLILLNGLFSMSEMALVSARKFRLESARKRGSSGAKTALELSENPTRFLSTVQIGITLIGILLGVYSGENLTQDAVAMLQSLHFPASYTHQAATLVVVLAITYLSIVLGELLPKRLGMTFPEPIITVLAKPMQFLSVITLPFVWLLTVSNNLILRFLGIKNQLENTYSEEEIKSIVKESAKGGEIQDIEQNIVSRVFELGDRKVISLITHRSDLVYFTLNDTLDEVRQKISREKHSAYPVTSGNSLDHILGIVLLKDLFSATDGSAFSLERYIIEPIYFNENTYAYKVLEIFKEEQLHYGMVVDEYGVLQGMVTMDDVLDALIGESTEINQDEYQIIQRDATSWLVDGQYSLIEFAKYFNLDLTDEQFSRFTTVAGLIIHKTNEVPRVGETVRVGMLQLEVVDKDGQKIDKILVTALAETE